MLDLFSFHRISKLAVSTVFAVGMHFTMAADEGVYYLTVYSASDSVDSGLILDEGDIATITAIGSWTCGPSQCDSDPDGSTYPFGGTPLAIGENWGALVGSTDDASWFLIGSGPTEVEGPGGLFFSNNDCQGPCRADNSGSVSVTIVVTKSVRNKADILSSSGVSGNGIGHAPGLNKPFNSNSRAAEKAGKKK